MSLLSFEYNFSSPYNKYFIIKMVFCLFVYFAYQKVAKYEGEVEWIGINKKTRENLIQS